MKKSISIILICIIQIFLLTTSISQIQYTISDTSASNHSIPRTSTKIYGLLPSDNIPSGTLNITQGEIEVVLNFTDIVNRTTLGNETIPLHRWTTFIQGIEHNITGINPLHLIELVNLGYARTFQVWSESGANLSLDVSELIMHDSNYYKNAVNNATILALAIDDQWIGMFNESYGPAALFGDEYTEEMVIKDVNKISLETEWIVNITIDGRKVGELSRVNRTYQYFNYTTYIWGYNDDETNTSWGPSECTGYTIASITNLYKEGDCGCPSPDEEIYWVSFVSLSGDGVPERYTKKSIESGFTGVYINDPPTLLKNEKKLAILMDKIDNKSLDYSNGPYQFIAPGLLKENYIGQVVELRISKTPENTTITTRPTTTTTTKKIPGFEIGILIGCIVISTVIILQRRRR